ncbi:hypothetical protein HWV07_04335 [Natronomonas salina]|uniref:hypothetical protein n=1 Tax=Natronomonas salina TaxID=1710540 RepID=UPI0015B75495|nr:hypothetical protein [Natronomonas salina]QLD88302.1 hypothetical protein HWV07_04335 [Natronomonas salina]
MIDPDDVEINSDAIYFRAKRHVGTLVHPDDRDLPNTEARKLSFDTATRGSYRVWFYEVAPGDDQEELATALERAEGGLYDSIERIEPSELEALLEKRPDFEYLRVGNPKTAEKMARQKDSVERVSDEELAALPTDSTSDQ